MPARPAFLRFLAAAGLLMCATLTASSQGRDLRLVSTVWPPFTNVTGQPRVALDLVEVALDRSGVPSATTFVGNAQYASAITTGPFDGSGAAWRDAQREQSLIFSQP
ncbi:MAG: hypothetical protein Q8O42_10255 [Acidobacteriota bacterium]|nr:hypothetical protein [Acidobacteriota bacterium]